MQTRTIANRLTKLLFIEMSPFGRAEWIENREGQATALSRCSGNTLSFESLVCQDLFSMTRMNANKRRLPCAGRPLRASESNQVLGVAHHRAER